MSCPNCAILTSARELKPDAVGALVSTESGTVALIICSGLRLQMIIGRPAV